MLVSVEWLKNNLSNSDLVILDCRPRTMFLSGHLPNSKLIPFTSGLGFDGKLFQDKKI